MYSKSSSNIWFGIDIYVCGVPVKYARKIFLTLKFNTQLSHQVLCGAKNRSNQRYSVPGSSFKSFGMSYKHLSKAGGRVLEQMAKDADIRPGYYAKLTDKTTPAFAKPTLPIVNEESRFKDIKDWKFLPGDRVVVVKRGKWRGKVSRINEHEVNTNGYILEEGPTTYVPIPKDFWQPGQATHMANIPVPLRQEDIRLVADIDDPEVPGKTKTVAVRDIVFRDSYYDENHKKVMPYRCVVGQEDLIIPWPKPEETADGELATEAQIARERTYVVDSVVKSAIPKAALLTIRNPKSKFRRGVLTAKDISKLVAPQMPLPGRKAYIEQQKKLAQQPKPTLTDEYKEKIGFHVFEHFKKKI
ncbi:mitochondrial 54S ribosomal protein uL24m Ecym_2366 [Eremothecium cymbalariae DBVPG|uniref:KOW domain-containing protein n=1 Tax=Eremothecium cymbalariae (strain CBS 270.75 / DBVPG 7215 / KCTC 17166 / NRRL Y-17582) TaxID=931890 RepID=G8JNN1_ERECY|nr:Hypothetical protein Ecym_2366 [Eremothecium cymbalariae DBVPG\